MSAIKRFIEEKAAELAHAIASGKRREHLQADLEFLLLKLLYAVATPALTPGEWEALLRDIVPPADVRRIMDPYFKLLRPPKRKR